MGSSIIPPLFYLQARSSQLNSMTFPISLWVFSTYLFPSPPTHNFFFHFLRDSPLLFPIFLIPIPLLLSLFFKFYWLSSPLHLFLVFIGSYFFFFLELIWLFLLVFFLFSLSLVCSVPFFPSFSPAAPIPSLYLFLYWRRKAVQPVERVGLTERRFGVLVLVWAILRWEPFSLQRLQWHYT